MMKVIYKPLGILMGALGGMAAGAVFRWAWRLLRHEERAPKATDKGRGWREVLAAAALQGAIFGAVQAFFDRAGAAGFERATGEWPGEG